jgi:spore coat protein U-like protein
MSISFASSPLALCFLALGLVSRHILAATPTASFGVTATVQAGCLVSATASAPWTYAAPVANAISAVSVTCTSATPYIVDLCAGVASGATGPNRRITGPFPAWLGYKPVLHFKGIVNWNQAVGIDRAAGTGTGFSGMVSAANQSATRQYTAAGGIGDIVTLTVTY